MKGSRDKGESQFETGGAGIKQIQSEMGRGNQALNKKFILWLLNCLLACSIAIENAIA